MVFIEGVCIGVLVSAIAYSIIIKGIKDNYNKWESQYKSESKMYKPYKDSYYKLALEYNKVVGLLDFYKKNSNGVRINDEIKSAIRFAMIHSHPDKGICKNNNEFIKFRKLYDEHK